MYKKLFTFSLLLLNLIQLGCSTIKDNEDIEIQKFCMIIIANPDTLWTVKNNPNISFINPNAPYSRDDQISDSVKVQYLKKWFSTSFHLDTTFIYYKVHPYFNGKSIERIERKIYHVDFISSQISNEFDNVERKYFSFEFFSINDKWLLADCHAFNLEQMRKKFFRLNK